MLATQTTDSVLEGKNVKQWIKEKIAQTLKTLQKRYVTTDAPVTSEDLEANQLCCALEAVFIQGLRSKHIRVDGGGARSRKGPTLPQPVFWNLLKTVTHRDVILELEGLSFINTDVGRCRAWVRLALNDGLLECYLASLLREGGKLGGYYQPGALLLDPEDREVLLSLLQGLSSLAFQLSYKSAVLNEWTTTPLALAGLCPAVLADDPQLPSRRRESWDTVSQSSGGSGGSDRGGAEVISRGLGREVNGVCDFRSPLTASDLSLDTASLSQLSSSLGSDDPLQTQVQQSPERENWNLDINLGHDSHHRSIFGEESSSSSQDLIKEDMDMTSPAPDSLVESSTHSSSEDNSPRPPLPLLPAPITDMSVSCVNSAVLEAEVLKSTISSHEFAVVAPIPVVTESFREEERRMEGPPATCSVITVTAMTSKPVIPTLSSPSPLESVENSRSTPAHRTSSILGRQTSSLSISSFHKSPSWISEEDFYTPDSYRNASCEEADVLEVTQRAESLSPDPEPALHQRPPSVIHRRQIGLSNPFRGLLKLGQLERRNAMGLWRDYYCELSPFEIRLYGNAEERSCCENCSLLRCEDVHLSTSGEGRFQITFSGKKLYLRAPSRGEAEDWVDRILEAIEKLRPATREDQWEVLQSSADQEVPSPSSTLSSPGRAPLESPEPQEMDWKRPTDLEPDAIKEAVVCLSQEDRGWSSLVLSLSLEALKGFSVEDGHKMLLFMHPIESVRDVVPDVALGGPAFFKVLTAQDALTVRAENGNEAQSWRSLIRGALNSYLESEDDVTGEEVVSLGRGHGGSVQRLVQHRLKGDGLLLSYLTVVPTERGLDAQNFKCAGCPKQIGVSLGRVRLCEFSGQYYCDTCHYGDRVIIPSRMVHNWDLTAREVSRQAQKLLVDVEHEPLLNIDLLNPDLFDHSDTMATVRFLRQKLRLLGDYLLICRSEIQKQIANRLGQRTYLLESSHLYSVLDLRQIADGLYVSILQSLIQISSSHVFNCDLCTQRGFICQICNKGDIIFPFQFDTTYRCKLCKTVFHSHCKTESFSCPRCERLQRYQERDLLE